MSWKDKKQLRDILYLERGYVKKEWGGRNSVALVYPSEYRIGMANLAVHSLYKIINDRKDFLCERFFLPKRGEPFLSLESQKELNQFDVIAFSISFENDFLNVLPMLRMGKIKAKRSERGGDDPVLIAGGAASTLNPNILKGIFDLVYLGEVEENIDALLEKLTLATMSRCHCEEQSDEAIHNNYVKDLDKYKTQTVIYSSAAQFGDMHLIEIMRGCPYPCKFCCTPKLYSPPRYRSFDAIKEMIDDGGKHRTRFGLIGASLGRHPEFERVVDYIHKRGFTFSPSSLRVDAITGQMAQFLKKSAVKSISLGLEAGSEDLRNAIGKPISEQKIMAAVDNLKAAGVNRLRLYFMIGLACETSKDIEEIFSLTKKISREFKNRLDLTINPFVPKPLTPWAQKSFAGIEYLKDVQKKLRALFRREKGVSIRFEPVSNAKMEYLLSHGDENMLFDFHYTS